MLRFSGAALVGLFAVGLVGPARADEQAAKAIVDKAIKAMGGEERLAKVKAFSEKGKGTILFEGFELAFTFETTAKGRDQYRATYEGESNGEKFSGATVLDGDKGWKKVNDNTEELTGEKLANEKRNAYLDVTPVLLAPLKGKGFKLDSAGDETVDGKPAVAVRVTGPDGKEFTLSFDKESGLPVKLNARVVDYDGTEYTQDTSFEDYRDFDGIKVATRSRIKKNGERYIEVEGVEFKVIDEVPPATFAEPK